MTKALSRKIYISGEITTEAFTKFSRRLSRLERESSKPIEIELISEGGCAYDALAFAGRMRNSKCELIVKAYGLVASAAVIILAYGDKRYMAREAWLMVHEDSAELDGSVTDIEKAAAHMRRLEDQWANLLTQVTSTSYEVWETAHANTTFYSANECKILGLIDEVI